MSLISFRNFLAPFSSKIQIGALLVLAFLAFVVRYQSSVDDGDSRPSAPRALTARRWSAASAKARPAWWCRPEGWPSAPPDRPPDCHGAAVTPCHSISFQLSTHP